MKLIEFVNKYRKVMGPNFMMKITTYSRSALDGINKEQNILPVQKEKIIDNITIWNNEFIDDFNSITD